MSDTKDDKTISVSGKKTLTLKRSGVEQGTVRQDMGRGRTKAVVVETRKRRLSRPEDEKPAAAAPVVQPKPVAPQRPPAPARVEPRRAPVKPAAVLKQLSASEMDARKRALANAKIRDAEERLQAEAEAKRRAAEEAARQAAAAEEARLQAIEDARRKAEEEANPTVKVEEPEPAVQKEPAAKEVAQTPAQTPAPAASERAARPPRHDATEDAAPRGAKPSRQASASRDTEADTPTR